MLDHLREGDTLIVWKLDRPSRSLKDMLHIMERIAAVGAGRQGLRALQAAHIREITMCHLDPIYTIGAPGDRRYRT